MMDGKDWDHPREKRAIWAKKWPKTSIYGALILAQSLEELTYVIKGKIKMYGHFEEVQQNFRVLLKVF